MIRESLFRYGVTDRLGELKAMSAGVTRYPPGEAGRQEREGVTRFLSSTTGAARPGAQRDTAR